MPKPKGLPIANQIRKLRFEHGEMTQSELAEKVKKGGVGTWGQVPMPPNPNVKDPDVAALVKWVLATK